MKFFPKVTTNLSEFFKLSKSKPKDSDGINGYYARGIIWTRNLNPKTILHELIHHLTKFPHNHNLSCSLILFFDFLNDVHDLINGVIFYEGWRVDIHECIEVIKESWNDFLDWILCRDVE